MNTELLEQVIEHIREEPRRLDMLTWGLQHNTGEDENIPPCGTTACIAGWVNMLEGEEEPFKDQHLPTFRNPGERAKEYLELEHIEGENLFHVHRWPARFKNAYQRVRSFPRRRADVTIDRIRHFIETGE